MSFPIIDAHQHVWDPQRAAYDWLGPHLAPVDRAFALDELLPELRACGVDATVQVQSADNHDDTALMVESAARHQEVVAIVGFAPLHDPAGTAATIEAWRGNDLIVGVRNLIHEQPDPDWLLRPEVDESLGLLEDAGLTFDVVSVLPRHLEHVPGIAGRHPRLRIVIDHLSKPPVGLDSAEPWASLIAAAAEHPLVHAKVSGLYAAAGDPGGWSTDLVRPHVEFALERFGAQRLMFGGDWPISLLAGGYTRVWRGLAPIIDALSPVEREWLLGRTAAEFYGISTERLRLVAPGAIDPISHRENREGIGDLGHPTN